MVNVSLWMTLNYSGKKNLGLFWCAANGAYVKAAYSVGIGIQAIGATGHPDIVSYHEQMSLICNKLTPSQLEKFAAIIDRGHLVYFDPPPIEIHNETAKWFWDQEIYDYIGDRLDLVKDLSARTYTKAYERKEAGSDWKKWIDTVCCHDATMRLVKDAGKQGLQEDG